MPTPSFTCNIGYHDYIALIAMMDADWSRRGLQSDDPASKVPSLANHRQFDIHCGGYRRRIVRAGEAWQDAVARGLTAPLANGISGDIDAGHPEKLSSYLYAPASYSAVGDADDISIVLLDDFDAIHHLTSTASLKIENVSVGFCPRIADLGLEGTDDVFCELHELLDGDEDPAAHLGGGDRAPGFHGFQGNMPLLVITKFKMHGLVSVGEGLLTQQALFKAMAREVMAVMGRLKGGDYAPLLSEGDIESTRCCFLDMQGSEEIGMLVFTRNYSVALTLVAALRSLTFTSLFQADQRLVEILATADRYSDVHRAVLDIQLARIGSTEEVNFESHLADNHVFRWTRSFLTIAADILHNGIYDNCSGYIEAMTEMQLAPGHHACAEMTASCAAGDTSNERLRNGPSKMPYHSFFVGTGDMILFHGFEPETDFEDQVQPEDGRNVDAVRRRGTHLPLVTMASLLETVRDNIRTFGRSRTSTHGRDVVELIERIIVPALCADADGNCVANVCQSPGDGNGRPAPLSDLLPILSNRLCRPYGCGPDDLKRGDPGGRLSIHKLREFLPMAGIPRSLGRSIEHIYNTYAAILRDPFLFDVVLDLYDSFASLHVVLTEHLPVVRKAGAKDNHARPVLDEGRVRQLAGFVDAMRNALVHRMYCASKEPYAGDMGMDLRGGLNQILFAADAPMKCGLGVMRLYTDPGGKRLGRERVGALTRIGLVPGATSLSLVLGTEEHVAEPTRLGFFEVDVPHITHIASYYDFIHEACHLIYNTLSTIPSSRRDIFNIDDQYIAKAVAEIFATLLAQLLVFGKDSNAAVFDSVVTFSRSLKSVGLDDRDTRVRFTELFVRSFIVADTITNNVVDDGAPLPSLGEEWREHSQGVKHPRERFKKMLGDIGPLFSEYDRLWGRDYGTKAWRYSLAQFENIYSRVVGYLPSLWYHVREVYDRYRGVSVLPNGEKGMPKLEDFIQEIKDGLASP